MKAHILTSLIAATSAIAASVDGPHMVDYAPGMPPKPLPAHWPAPSQPAVAAPWGLLANPASPMDPRIIFATRAVSTWDYVNNLYNSGNPSLGMVHNNALGFPIPPAPALPGSLAVTWTGFGVGATYAWFPVPPTSYAGGLPLHNDGVNAMGIFVGEHTPGPIPNVAPFGNRAASPSNNGSDEVMFQYMPANGLPMRFYSVEVEDLSYRAQNLGGGNWQFMVEACSVYVNGSRVGTYLPTYFVGAAATPTSLRNIFQVAYLGGGLVGHTAAANATMRTLPTPNKFTTCRIPTGFVLNPNDVVSFRYDDFSFRTTLAAGVHTFAGNNPLPPAGFNGSGWAISAITGQQ